MQKEKKNPLLLTNEEERTLAITLELESRVSNKINV
jgi:hypothetical protein